MSLKQTLEQLVVDGELFTPLDRGRVRCLACGHRCVIFDGLDGICRVRFNRGGRLLVPHGYVGALQLDPIEKKPFFHVLPGARAMSFGMLGCDLHCAYCQNWVTSQALRDPAAVSSAQRLSAKEFVQLSLGHGAAVVTSTYNEPLITAEWAVDVFRQAHDAGLRTSFVSNGNGTPEVLEYLRPHLDFMKIDLKSFRDPGYRKLGGVLKNVLDTIERVHRLGIWLEIVTLIIPGFNDSNEELRDAARFLAGVSPDIPWHVTAFHPDYRMTEPEPTSVSTILRACDIGRSEGLHFVYGGNLPGLSPWENTCCPDCNAVLVERRGFRVIANRLTGGRCPQCARTVPGRWLG